MSVLAVAFLSMQLSACPAPDLSQTPAAGERLAYDLNGFNVAHVIESSQSGVVEFRAAMAMPPGAPQPPEPMHTSVAGLFVTSSRLGSQPGMSIDVERASLLERLSALEAGDSVSFSATRTSPAPGGGVQRARLEAEITFMGCGQETTPGGVFDVAVFQVTQSMGGEPTVTEVAWAPALGWPVREATGEAVQSYTGSGV